MSDTLNQLIRGPAATFNAGGAVQVNPLAAITAGNQAAQEEFKTRGLQANQALGQILQQSTDANGNVDYQDAQRRAAAAGPIVQAGMQSYLTNNSNLRGQQIQQATGLHSFVTSLGASLMNDPSDDNVAKIRAMAVNAGLPAGALTEIDRIGALPPEQRGTEAYKHVVGNLDALGKLSRSPYAAPESVDTGTGGRVPVQTVPPSPYGPGGARVLGGGVTSGPQPGQTTPSVEPFDEQGQIPRDANGVPTRTPKTWQQTTVPVIAVPGVPRGGEQIGPGGGGGQGPAPRGSAPSVTVPPPPAGNTSRPSAPPPGTGAGGGGAGGATQPPPPATQPPTGGAGGSTRPPIVTAPPQTQPEELEAAAKHAGDARARTLTYQRDIQPIEGAITNLARADTGKASETLNSIRATVQDLAPGFLQRMLPSSVTDPKTRQAFEEANKYLTQMQLAAPGGSRSDAGASAAGAATPSVHISNAAAREVAIAILAQRRMEQAGTLLFNQSGKTSGEFDRHMGQWNTQADPRAFVVDKMTPPERADYVKSLGGTDTPAYKRYRQSAQDAINSGVMQAP